MKMENLEEPKDKQTSSHCISFSAIYTYTYIHIYIYTYIYIYICLWRWKPAATGQLSAWTIGSDHIIIAERIFSPWVTSPLGSQVDYFTIWVRESAAGASRFMWTTLDALFLLDITSTQACTCNIACNNTGVMQCEQWAPTGRNINLHL